MACISPARIQLGDRLTDIIEPAVRITIAREDYVRSVPFDIAPYRVLIYPKPGRTAPRTTAAYRTSMDKVIQQLATEITRIIQYGELITNPVQDFMSSRSPLTSVESQYLDRLDPRYEEELLKRAKDRVVHVGLTGAHFTMLLTGYIESCIRQTPLAVDLAVLSPDDHRGWEFVYEMREGRIADRSDFPAFMEENRVAIEKTRKTIQRLSERFPAFRGRVFYYSGVSLFWAYVMDENRLILGHLGLNRISSLSLSLSLSQHMFL